MNVILRHGRKEQAPVGQLSAQASADGHYAFNGLNRDPNFVYILLARFQNVNYPTDQPFQLQDQPNYQTDITVYDATTADDAIKLERLNLLVVGADQGVVQFMEMGSVVNSGDRTFVTANPQDQALARALKFALPNGALGVQMQTGFNDQDVIPGPRRCACDQSQKPRAPPVRLSFQVPYGPAPTRTSRCRCRIQRGRTASTSPIRASSSMPAASRRAAPPSLVANPMRSYTANNLSRRRWLAASCPASARLAHRARIRWR